VENARSSERDARLLDEQMRYYDDRAPEYQDLWFRRGRHDLGDEFNERWFRETAIVERAVDDVATTGAVLEIGCGSGLWTRRLAPHASRYVAVDSSRNMLELNRARNDGPNVEFVLADAFDWQPPNDERFDLIFFGFFISHVPPEAFAGWWARIRSWLTPSGHAFIVDDTAGPDRPYSGDVVDDGPKHAHRRHLSDGREYTIVKVFYEPAELAVRLSELSWNAEIRGSGQHFLYGSARPVPAQP
jgi:demethylmenaquinone methyltransferase/2-methoxy-6-polyprenyl-1,4-benzoquinol methylase